MNDFYRMHRYEQSHEWTGISIEIFDRLHEETQHMIKWKCQNAKKRNGLNLIGILMSNWIFIQYVMNWWFILVLSAIEMHSIANSILMIRLLNEIKAAKNWLDMRNEYKNVWQESVQLAAFICFQAIPFLALGIA